MFLSSYKDKFEIKVYNRKYFLEHFNIKKNKCFFLLYLFFLDNFDLYRNFYKNLIFISFNFNKRI